MSTRALHLGANTYPVTLPNVRDARLHVAAVIVTIHVLGQVALGFHVSVPQILSAILTCAVIEIAITFRRSRAFVWPASAMLTGSGVALIMRVPSTPVDDHWSTHRWYLFAGVAGLSLATKYLIRYRGSHLFNPSNLGLVAAFLVLGSERVEPLDFWWAPLDAGMVIAYVVILGGGIVITRRLGLLATAATFWLTLAAGIGVLAASGHCMVARWAFSPVCGADYWRAIMGSPELMIFMFFMITDPRTVPTGRVGRCAFGFLVAVTSTLLMAPQSNEFGTKVALLGGLVIVCAERPLLDRLLPAPRSAADDLGGFLTGLVAGRARSARRMAAGVAVALAATLGLGTAIVAAGGPAREVPVPAAADVVGREPRDVDPATLPSIRVDQDVVDWNHEISGRGVEQIVLTLAENLQYEAQALRSGDGAILEAVAHGDRLDEMEARLAAADASGQVVVEHHRIEEVDVTLVVPFGRQSGLSLGLESRGTVTTETVGADGEVVARTSGPFATRFVMGRPTGGRWMTVAVQPLDAG